MPKVLSYLPSKELGVVWGSSSMTHPYFTPTGELFWISKFWPCFRAGKTYYCSEGVAWIFTAWGIENESSWFRQWTTRDWEGYSMRGDQAGMVAGGVGWCLLALGGWSTGWDPQIGVQREGSILEQCCLAGMLASRDCLWTLRLSPSWEWKSSRSTPLGFEKHWLFLNDPKRSEWRRRRGTIHKG